MTLAEHLIQLGHKRFGIISSRLTEDFREDFSDWSRLEHDFYYPEKERLIGYRLALEEANIDLSHHVRIFEGKHSATLFGRRAIAAFLAAEFKPTAVIAISDMLAIGAIEQLKESGFKVPNDVCVVDCNIDYSDIPPLGKEFLKKAAVPWPPPKQQLTIRLDTDVLAWLRAAGRGYQTRINRILRAAMESQPERRRRSTSARRWPMGRRPA